MSTATGTSGAGAPTPGEVAAAVAAMEAIFSGDARGREKFVPVTRHALMERLTREHAWPAGQAADARRFFRYLDHYRAQTYSARLLELERIYEPFSPDTDLLITRKYSPPERERIQKQLVARIEQLLRNANYQRIDNKNVSLILTKDSHYGLDLDVDLEAFEELLIFYRGAVTHRAEHRGLRRFFGRKQEFDVPIFQRLFVLFKLKPEAARARELMASQGLDREAAEKLVRKLRSHLPDAVKEDNVYLKLFKNMPRADMEMVFPNTRVRFRTLDKLKLGVTSGAGLGMGAVASAGKIALIATNPLAAAGAVVGFGGVAFRQAMKFVNQRNQYMITMAQNLYFHAMADNRSAMTALADRASEEDVKEEMLLYSVLAKADVHHREVPEVDEAIEQYMLNTFGVSVNFDVEDALQRLVETGLVREQPDGRLVTLPPGEAARHLDILWDRYLDELPDPTIGEGIEVEIEDDGRPA